jgi:3-oxoacyl-[acyl-carrier protein] reductase
MADKVAVITGASRGLGLALVDEFIGNGWITIGTGRSERPGDFPEDAIYKQFDAGDAEVCTRFWKQLHDEHPDAEVSLVNNAGGYVSGSLIAMKPEDYDQQMNSIYFTAVYMTHGLAAAFSSARIINVISSSALEAHKNNSAYGAAKAAEMHFFQSLQQEFKPEQYRITNLYPSDIATHGANPDAVSAEDLASFIREQTESQLTYYLRDATVYPIKRHEP